MKCDLTDLTDFSNIFQDELIYMQKTVEPEKLIEEKNPKMLGIIKL